MSKSLLPALAKDLAGWFPEVGGRFFAVSEVEPFDNATNVPTLPIGFVALVAEAGTQTTPNGHITLLDDILLQLAFEPVKYKTEGGADSPFFAYYDFEPIRDKLLALTKGWRSPRNVGLMYRSMDVEATELAVYLNFRFAAETRWCYPEEYAEDPVALDIVARTHMPRSTVPCAEPCPPETDPCDAARRENPHGRESRDA